MDWLPFDFSSWIGFGVAAITVLVFVGILISVSRSRPRKEVLFLRPRDKRGERLDVTRETDRSVLCERSNPIHRFIKIGPAWVFHDGRRTITRFLGVEGKAYTAVLKGDKKIEMSIHEYLQSIWGKKIYESMPKKLRRALERDKTGVIVDVDVPEPEGLPRLTSDDINDEGDAVVLNRLARMGTATSIKQQLYHNLVWFFLGLGFAAILSHMGWF